jgi:hypothetical protein
MRNDDDGPAARDARQLAQRILQLDEYYPGFGEIALQWMEGVLSGDQLAAARSRREAAAIGLEDLPLLKCK